MASPKTFEQQAVPLSRFATTRSVSATPEERAAAMALPPGQRRALQTWQSADKRTIYAYDGISIRLLKVID